MAYKGAPSEGGDPWEGIRVRKIILSSEGRNTFKVSDPDGKETYFKLLIVVFPCMLTIIQLLFQQNAHVFYY
jgi:hypothetical protein